MTGRSSGSLGNGPDGAASERNGVLPKFSCGEPQDTSGNGSTQHPHIDTKTRSPDKFTMNEQNVINTLLSQDLQVAITKAGTYIPNSAMADFDGQMPLLQWLSPQNPHNVPNSRYSEFVSAPKALFKVIPHPHPSQSIYPAGSSERRQGKPLANIVDDLLSPGYSRPWASVNHQGMATIDMNFVMKCMGGGLGKHLEFSKEAQRVVLKQGSGLLHYGRAMGMPELYMQWLGGANAEVTLRIPLATLRAALLKRQEILNKPNEQKSIRERY
ncbi:hypothetical protein K458DRAFT_388550 [Lentithecium fluviatile CBS 122367]|uniref:Uncharacterized protein n=1 Tax=Lentithecium fluviatile CBS 122367 TaxID=1168545 RepID=A0A6G1J2V3_9PLEO|nr:hypothetical protein K458DRAFT_388550 [Lentithecium fluviatile CBS 122367]